MTVSRTARGVARVGVGLLLLAAVVPLLWVLRVALKPQAEFVGDPGSIGGGFTLVNFADAWRVGGLQSGLVSSVVVVGIGSVVAVLVAALAAYGLALLPFPGRGVVLAAATVALFLPLAALVIPIFDQALAIGLLDSRPGLGLIYGALFCSWTTLFLVSAFSGVPAEALEAARLDGAGVVRMLTSIALPMVAPALATAFMLNVFLQWSELILALILLPSTDSQTVSVAIAQYSTQFRTGGPLTAAGMIIAALPILLVFTLGQRWFRAGMLSGGSKE